jgi:hypothetical protein
MESVLRGHPESNIPFCVKSWRILDLPESGIETSLFEDSETHQARREITLEEAVRTDAIGIEILDVNGDSEHIYGGIFEVRVYEE